MKQKTGIAIIMAAFLLLTGCQSGPNNGEIESLKEQIARLEQQISVLEQQNSAVNNSDTVSPRESSSGSDVQGQSSAAANSDVQGQSSSANKDAQGSSVLSTTYTMEELTAMVDAYVEKADAAVPGGTASENMEQFFSLKQEEKQVDAALDLHEDELENLYRQNFLTRDEYKSLERDLERLEDQLDDAEDRLEYIFGIDD